MLGSTDPKADVLAQSIEELSSDPTQCGSKNWRALAIPRTIPIDSTRDRQTMHTIQFGNRTYTVSDPMAARLLREASSLEREGRAGVARGLLGLALKVEDGTLNAAAGTEQEAPVRDAA